MTTQDIIKQTESFTIEQKQQLAYYFLFSTISEDKKQEFMHLFHYKNDVEDVDNNNLLNIFSSWKNKLPEKTEINPDDIYNSIVAKQFFDGYSKEDDIYNSL